MKLEDIKPNPINPRETPAEKLHWLDGSLDDFGDLSGFVFRKGGMIISGHQRWDVVKDKVKSTVIAETFKKPLKDGTIERGHFEMQDGTRYGYSVRDWNDEKAAAATIRANAENVGKWRLDILTGQWNFKQEQLIEFGVPEVVFEFHPNVKIGKKNGETQNVGKQWVPDCLFPSNNIYEIPTLDINRQAEFCTNPVIIWGAEKRTKKISGGTVLFYVDDYRFNAIWDDPSQILETGCSAISEPNVSIYDTMPVSYALHLIYKKRWIARYLQTVGINILVDLNVSAKFSEYNLLGVPDGWNAFSTRGYLERTNYLEDEIELAKRVSGKENPLIVVYGGGLKIREIVAKHNLIYVEQFRDFHKNKNNG